MKRKHIPSPDQRPRSSDPSNFPANVLSGTLWSGMKLSSFLSPGSWSFELSGRAQREKELATRPLFRKPWPKREWVRLLLKSQKPE